MGRLRGGTIAERFASLVEHKIHLLMPHKDAFGALLSAAVDPSSNASVMGDASSRIRDAMRLTFLELVSGATDAPGAETIEPVALVLYASHLALLLVWVHDESRGARRTHSLLETARGAIGFVRPLLAAPGAASALTRVATALAPIFWKEKRK
ncbi:MAG: hypothetical protein NVS3B10_20930 [Polyangiales bacterium]